MIELNWGSPLALHSDDGTEIKAISTIEQARYWLEVNWPTSGAARDAALSRIDAAMECLLPVSSARAAFVAAASVAGFSPANKMQHLPADRRTL
ncbi:DUF982 domain-containing protein [Paracoccus zeaxanthinifaciens]|uniref:DUF982 domain-containing protein n=1 Tax=Paracoccus zeaxanthinifaciens TaxID=187400 RepID=UPI0003B72870|nr:DUF982 domain-containing protein [Paracoccus zeaxanthinifaciens]